MPRNRGSSAHAEYVPALCTHRPSLLPIEWLGEEVGLTVTSWQRGRRLRSPSHPYPASLVGRHSPCFSYTRHPLYHSPFPSTEMPRRRAPTALRLHNGPIPAWNVPKITLPKPPVASLAPKRPLPKVSITTRSRSSSLQTPPPARLPQTSHVAIKAVEHWIRGPWDRSRGFAVAEGEWGPHHSPITTPQPVASLLSPGLVW